MVLEELKYECKIKLTGIPIQWLSKFELYYPDLPQFPIVYVHTIKNGTRIYGFPLSLSSEIVDDKTCNMEYVFISNVNAESDQRLKTVIKKELEERFGLSDKVGLNDVLSSCKGNKANEAFFRDLWTYVSKMSGDYVPYGKFYEEVYSIIRFVSAWQPKTGRQSEMRMLYNFLSIFGERIEIRGKWDYLEFYLLPTYDEISGSFNDFPKFKSLMAAIKKVWNTSFTESQSYGGKRFMFMPNSWPQDKDTFINEVTRPMLRSGKIDIHDQFNIERLVDAFNRHSWRAAFFIWSIMTGITNDYRSWDKALFEEFYLNKKGVGASPKVVACFLQQGFKNYQVIPVDTWIQSFYEFALGIDSMKAFFASFSNLGKLERIIWMVSQMKKTNMAEFFDTLWCIRYGVTGNSELRGPNPIGCYECKLKQSCPGYSTIKNTDVMLVECNGRKPPMMDLFKKAEVQKCVFICLTEDFVPKKAFSKRGRDWKLIDEFSGYILKDQRMPKKYAGNSVKVDEFIKSLPEFRGSSLPAPPEP